MRWQERLPVCGCRTAPVMLAHESPILQVFQNMIGNALKYRSERPVRIHVSAYCKNAEWVVRVEDNGIGV